MPPMAEIEWDPFTDAQNGFVAVTYAGAEGWAARQYLWLWPSSGKVNDDLNLRSEPGLGSEVIDVIPAGTEIQILGGPQNNYLAVRYDQVPGWVSLDYVVVFQSPGGEPPADGEFPIGQRVSVATDALNYRSEP